MNSSNGGHGTESPLVTVTVAREAVLDFYRANPSVETAELIVQFERAMAAKRATHGQGVPLPARTPLTVGTARLDPTQRTFTRADGVTVILPPMECAVLYLLMSHVGRVLTTTQIAQAVSREGSGPLDANSVRQFILRVRRAIEPDPTHPRSLVTVPGIGYTFVPDDSPHS